METTCDLADPTGFPDAPLVKLATGANNYAGVSRWRELVKLHVRAILSPRATIAWLAAINSRPMLQALALARPRLIGKIYRPYLTNTLSFSERLGVLQSHYDFVARRGLSALALNAGHHPVELASIVTKSATAYRIALRAVEPMEREGELAIQLMRGETLVFTAAFSFFRSGGGMEIGVGCMQGPKGDAGLGLIKEATRDMHGLRPKNLMVRLLSALGHALGCHALRLVGNGNRAVNRARREGKVHADYDTLWRECGALPRADGDYHLDCEMPGPPDLLRVPSNKRSSARKRYETVDLLVNSVLKTFKRPGNDPGNHRPAPSMETPK